MGKKKKFKIPVSWMVMDFVEVEAESFEDAYNYVVDNVDDIPLGIDPVYVDGSYEVGEYIEALGFNDENGAIV